MIIKYKETTYLSCSKCKIKLEMSAPSGGPVLVNKVVKLLLGAGLAKPGPAIGQALGPLGLNMAEFCKQFNDRTKAFVKDTPTPVVLTGLHVERHRS